jgi:shikimate dehydrogenase
VVGVIGDPIAHSWSPMLHNAAFDALGLDWVSVAFPVGAGRADEALTGMRALAIAGLSVTMPHKEQAFGCVDEASEVARLLGAVNCVTRGADGTLVGDSTDGDGFLAALRRGAGFEPAGQRCLVVGAGGAARAVVLALARAGAAEVVVLNRTPSRGEAAAALAGPAGRLGTGADVAGADLVVQATPLGMAGRPGAGAGAGAGAGTGAGAGAGAGAAEELPFDPELLRAGQVVTDLVYHPLHTPALRAAAGRGATVVTGLGMLVHQAALALGHWTGVAVPVEAMWAVARAHVAAGGGRD